MGLPHRFWNTDPLRLDGSFENDMTWIGSYYGCSVGDVFDLRVLKTMEPRAVTEDIDALCAVCGVEVRQIQEAPHLYVVLSGNEFVAQMHRSANIEQWRSMLTRVVEQRAKRAGLVAKIVEIAAVLDAAEVPVPNE